MSLAIADIGLTEEQLQDRVVETMADKLLKQLQCDSDGDEFYAPSQMEAALKKLVEKRIAEAIDRTAAAHVLPRVDEIIESFTIQETNQWGEAKGKKAVTFTEFLVGKAESYMQEKVDFSGKTKAENGSYSSWNGTQTRLTHAIHQHLHYAVEKSMKEVIGDGTGQIAKALHETCRLKINEIAGKLKVDVSTGK